jgi:OFA family oxalate/formate antiporter-like MFS transporter
MVIGIAMLFGRDALAASGLAKYAEPKVAETAASTAYAVFFALANGFGRIGWGLAADRLGWKRSIVTMASAQAIAIAGLYHLGSSFPALCLLLAVIGANFGGTLALFPLATAGSFGTANVGQNYGFMFTAYGVGGLLGPIAAGLFKDLGRDLGVEAWRPPLMLASALCLGAASIIWRVGDRDASPPPTRARAARHPLPPDQQVSAADAGAVSSRFTIQSERR